MPDDLFAVSVVDAGVALAAGYWGSIYRTEDGGKTWTKTETGTKRLIDSISMADAQNGWAVGQLSLVLRTADGGKTWQRQSTPKDDQGVHLFAAQAVSAQQAIVVGEWGTRLLTEDGGQTWQDHSLTISEEHPQFVWLTVPEQDKVRRGEKVFEDVTLNDVSCLAANRQFCWIIGEFAYLFRSEDGGRTWERGKIESGIEIQPITMGHNARRARRHGEAIHHRFRAFWRIRRFLREVFLLNDRLERSWHVARLDYWRWHLILNCRLCESLEAVTTLWETGAGSVAAVLHPIRPGEVRLHVHPRFRTARLVDEMLSSAEEKLSTQAEQDRRFLYLPVDADDDLLLACLSRRGYVRQEGTSHKWWCDLVAPPRNAPVPPGYTVRSMGEVAEHPARSLASWRAFHADEPDGNYDDDCSWYRNIQSAPLSAARGPDSHATCPWEAVSLTNPPSLTSRPFPPA